MDGLARTVEEFFHSPVQVAAAVITIAFGISAALKGGRRLWMKLWAGVRSRPFVPTETLRIVQDIQQSHWGLGSSAGTPSMMVVFQGHVTDISGRMNRVLRAEIPKPLTYATTLDIHDDYDARREQVLAPFESTDISAMFFVQSVVAEAGKSCKTTLVFIDQYNNPHKVKNCVFRGLAPPQTASTPAG
jgi:hypothetical protein